MSATLVYSSQTTQRHSSDDSGLYFLLESACRRILDFMSKYIFNRELYRGGVKSLAQPGRKQATLTEDFDVHISYL